MITKEELKEIVAQGFHKGYIHAFETIINTIKATGKLEAIISIDMLEAVIKASEE